jgi:hypothetical protein
MQGSLAFQMNASRRHAAIGVGAVFVVATSACGTTVPAGIFTPAPAPVSSETGGAAGAATSLAGGGGSGGGSNGTAGSMGGGGSTPESGGSEMDGSTPDDAGQLAFDSGFPPGATIGSCDPTKWVTSALASSAVNPPASAIDGIPVSRWSTGAPQAPGQTYVIDFGGYVRLARIVLDSTGSPGDHPRGYQVETSTDGFDFSNVIATGAPGDPPQDVVTIDLTPLPVRYLRMELTAASASWWSIHELRLDCQTPASNGAFTPYTPPADPALCVTSDSSTPASPDPFDRANWTATASSIHPVPADVITNAFDESTVSRWSSGQAQTGDEWFKLDLGSVACFSQVSIAAPPTDFPVSYALAVSSDDVRYTVVASGAGQALLQLSFMPRNARYLRINQFGTNGYWWSVSDITVQR